MNHSNQKNNLNFIRKIGFWLLASALILGVLSLTFEISFDIYWALFKDFKNVRILDFLFWYDLYEVLIILGMTLLSYEYIRKKTKLFFSSIIICALFITKILVLFFNKWDITPIYFTVFYYILSFVFYAYVFLIFRVLIKDTKNKIPLSFLLYSILVSIFIMMNDNFLKIEFVLGINNSLYLTRVVSLLFFLLIILININRDIKIFEYNINVLNRIQLKHNRLSRIIYKVGVAYLVLSILGSFILFVFLHDSDVPMKLGIITLVLVYSFVFSLVFFGAAEIIELLHLQNLKTQELIDIQLSKVSNSGERVNNAKVEIFEDLPDL